MTEIDLRWLALAIVLIAAMAAVTLWVGLIDPGHALDQLR